MLETVSITLTMAKPSPGNRKPPNSLSPEKYARLRAEAEAPYRGLRKFIYGALGASGALGGFVFLAQIAAGRDLEQAVPNFLLQAGVVALMVTLFRLESRSQD